MEHTDQTDTGTAETAIEQPRLNGEPEPATIKSPQTTEEVEEENRFQLLFDIEVSRRYNLRMARGFRRLGQLTRFLTIMGGSAAFVGLLSEAKEFAPQVGLIGTFVLTVATALDIVFGFESSSFEHRKNAKDYTDLLRKLKAGTSPKSVRQDYYFIEANEQAPFQPVMNIVHNQTLKNLNYDETDCKELAVPISWLQKPVFLIF